MIDLLRLAGLPWRGVNRTRRFLYRVGLLQAKRLPRPVISVGSIGAGGAGKTPAVIAVCRDLEERGFRVAVLTRGHGRGDRAVDGMVMSFDPDKYGDEPVLITQSIQGDVIVGKKRADNAIRYLRGNDCDVFILDDGFQHLQLHRDLDLVIDAPARIDREGRAALRHADVVIPRRLRTIVPENLRGARVFAFAGLADNDQFFASLRSEGLDLAGTKSFPDHHRYTAADLDAIFRDAGGATIVTSAKDAVKIRDRHIVVNVLVIGAQFMIEQEVLERIAATAEAKGNGNGRARRRRKSRLLQRVEYIAYRGVARVVAASSDETLSRWGTRLGALARRILRSRDSLAMRNLRAVFPERPAGELRKILDDCWRHFGREALQYLQTQSLSLDEVAARCPFANQRLLEESIARGKGTLLISAHWGGWEIAGLAVMSIVGDVRTVARPLDNELLERDLQGLRGSTGAEVVDRRRAARALMKGLAENAVVVLLPDQAVQPREGALVPFLGRPSWTTLAPARLALRSDSTIVFAFCIPDGLGHRLEFEEAIRVDLLEGEERDPVNLTKRINDIFSRRIIERPDLWLWMHDRWKGTPEGETTNGV